MNKPAGNKANLKRKGGTRYPKAGLDRAESYAKNLANKTHVSPQPLNIIAKGVFGAANSEAEIRLSACRQFGFVEGKNAALQASSDAKKLTAATEPDRIQILQRAFLKPDVFTKLYTGFQGDVKTKSEIKSQFQQLDVHPELTEECADYFIKSGLHCGLIVSKGDKFEILSAARFPHEEGFDSSEGGEEEEQEESFEPDDDVTGRVNLGTTKQATSIRNKSNVAITLDIDSTMDPEKLAKLVKILKDGGLV